MEEPDFFTLFLSLSLLFALLCLFATLRRRFAATGSFRAQMFTSSCPPLPGSNASFNRPSTSVRTCVATEQDTIS